MKYPIFSSHTVLISLTLLLVPALAQAHRCRFLRADARNLCLAKKENARYFCSYIKQKDQKNYCYAYLDLKPDQCSEIEEETLRTKCETEVKRLFELDQKKKERAAKLKEAQEALNKKRQEQQKKKSKKKK